MENSKTLIDIWDRNFGLYKDTTINNETVQGQKVFWDLVNKYISIKARNKVLVVGCGLGEDFYWFVQNECNVFGIDISMVALSKAKTLYKNQVNLVRGDGMNLPFKDRYFDLVFNIGVLEHFENPKRMLDEMNRVSDAVVIVAVPNKYSTWILKRKIMNLLKKINLSKGWSCGYERSYSNSELKILFNKTYKYNYIYTDNFALGLHYIWDFLIPKSFFQYTILRPFFNKLERRSWVPKKILSMYTVCIGILRR